MSDLVAFLNARLDEDEVRLKGWVAAKRAILAAWQDNESERDGSDSYTDGLADGLRLAVHYLAAVYSDHPDYQPEW